LFQTDRDLLNCIRWVKDLRRRTPDKGRPYFAHRLLTAEGKEKFQRHWPMEVAFNYLGQYQNDARKDILLQPDSGTGQSVNTFSDIGPDVPRFALIEISAALIQGRLNLSFSYHRSMERQASIRTWIAECQNLLREAPENLMRHEAEQTLSDFPLLPLSYDCVNRLKRNLQGIGVSSLNEIEDIYPCSPMQQGIYLSQLKHPEMYTYQLMFEVRPTTGHTVSPQQLAEAWQDVVQRHPSLRTVFVDSIDGASLVDQAVIKSVKAQTLLYECDEANVQKTLLELEPINCTDKKTPHRFAICKTSSEKVFCRLDISHAISDGSSIPLLLRDLSRAYMRIIPTSSSSPLYSDFIAHLSSLPKDTGNLYWKEYLTGVEPCLFPSLSAKKRAEKKLASHVLLLKQKPQLQAFCKNAGVTASNVLQLVWGLVLRCYTGSDEICFGYLSSGRDIPVRDIEDAVGAFINMLICRLNLADDLKLDEALQKMQTDFVRGMEHQTTSLAEVQHELGLSETSLFNTAFTFQRRSNIAERTPQSLVFDLIDTHDPSEYKIAVNVEASDVSTEVHFSYWMDSLSKDNVKDMADTFEHVLDNILHSDQQHSLTIANLDFFSRRSCQQVRRWNSEPPQKIEKCVHEIIEEQTRLQPLSAPAVCAWDVSFTYVELDTLSMRLATHLKGLGVGPDMFVPLCFEKSAWTIVAQLAVLKAGGAFVSVDPSHPESRLRNLINDVGAHLVLCSSQYHEKVSRSSDMTFIVSRDTISQLPNCTLTPPVPSANSTNAAYIIFTSGSTGKPKAIVIEHAAICASALAHSKAFVMNPNSRVFQFASYTFDASIVEILTTLMVGGCVCVPSDEERINDLPGAIKRMNANWTLLTPSVANTVKPESVPTLKVLVTGGEKMTAGFIEKWAKSVCLINAYGPSECSVVATTSTKVDLNGKKIDDDCAKIGKAPCGRSWIVDPRNYHRLVPVGAVGELVLESSTVARGYLNNEQKTNESFIKNPAWTNCSGLQDILKQRERMYRSGDLVRYNSDGTISYIARTDTQIKLNGQRIELGEIEYQCRQYLPDQTHVAVDLIVLGTQNSAKKLAIFFAVQNGIIDTDNSQKRINLSATPGDSNPDQLLLPMCKPIRSIAKNLENSLSGVLPSYMIPQLFFPVSNLPWTSSGKLDRRRLHSMIHLLSRESLRPYAMASSTAKEFPKTKMEQTLQSLWEKVLHLTASSVGTEDSFFRLGGDSLAAMSLVGAARSHGISLNVVNIFRYPVLADMARSCEVLKVNRQSVLKPFSLLDATEPINQIIDDVAGQCRVDKEMVSDIYPCSSLQEGLVALSVKQCGAYVAQNVFRLPGSADVTKFKAAWQQVVNEFDILRTRIVHTASMKFLQVVLKEQPLVWHTASHLQDISDDSNMLPDYDGGLLTRYTIIQATDSDERYFAWSIHHALYDGWSMSLILQRVENIYFESSSDPVKTSYAIFIDYLLKRDISASDEFWKAYLSEVSSSHFPPAPKSLSIQSPDTQTICGSTEIGQAALSVDITTPVLIRAAWAMIVSAYTSSDDVCFGETLTGRNVDLPGVTDVVGPILATVPTRIQVNRQLLVTDYLREVRRGTTEIIPHQHAGLQHIRRLNEDTAIACDFQNLLVVQTAEDGTNDQLWDLQDSGPGKAFFTYPLVIECRVSNSRVGTNIYYDAKVISGWQVQRLLYQFAFVLKNLSGVKKDDSRQVSDVEVFSPEDKAEVVRWNTQIPPCIDQCIHERFRQRCLSQPEALAVCAWDSELTYHQLDEYASQFAAYLSSLGVGPEIFVPICLDKSAWTIVAMLGILIAGGAIVPLDPSHPVLRHQEILEELNTSIILCLPKYGHRYSQFVKTSVQVDKEMITNLPLNNKYPNTVKQVTGSNTAYVIFTSGSTGQPKGIAIEHRAFTSSSAAFEPATLMKPTSRVLQFSSLSFDAAVLEIFTTLTCGACVCVPSEEERLKDLAGVIHRMGVSWTLLTPSVASLIDPATVPFLEVLACGGEAMSQEVIKKWANGVKLINLYGPTEAAIVATANARVASDQNPSCIGYGLSATLTWVVEPENHDRLSPLGAVGELALEGPTLARGYLNDVQKTAEAFVENPAWAASFSSLLSFPRRIFKTGDLVRYNPDGSLDYVGRKDNQVKLHGQRMDLGEIEHRLDADPRVRHVIVLLPKTGLCKQRLLAVLSLSGLSTEGTVIASGACELVREETRLKYASSDLVEIQNGLGRQLPSYMVPQTWAVVESLPMLVSGKLDRTKVKIWIENISEAAYEQIMDARQNEKCTTQATGVAAALQETWALVLNLPLERVNLNQSFLSLGEWCGTGFAEYAFTDQKAGGDSILAMDVVSRCRKQKINISLRDVLQSESITRLALTAGTGFLSVQYEEKTDEPFSLSPIQRLYFQSAKGYHGRSRFNQSISLRLTQRTDANALESAVRTIVRKHSMLRARFGMSNAGNWQQRITKVCISRLDT
jgi:amino acid adenylation domain-containing protein/non-ribosomal peptide synthase protein (TIGR01720 family)